MSDEQVFRLPDLGEGLTDGEIVEWHVAEGDEIEVDQVVVTVETAKAAVEVPCPYAGRVAALHGAVGDVLEVGKPLIAVAPPSGGSEPAAHQVYREEERAGSGAVLIGYGTSEAKSGRRRRVRPVSEGASAPSGQAAQTAPAPPAAPEAATPSSPERRVPAQAAAVRVISPIVRKLARDHGLDLSVLTGTGPDGLVRRCDVDAAVAALAVPAHREAAPSSALAAVPEQPAGEVRIPLRGVRRIIADKLSRSRREIPDATTWVDVDATGLLEARASLKAKGIQVGLLALLGRISVSALQRFPELNSYVDTEREEIVRLPHVNLGFAAQSDRGLVVPVVRGAHAMTTVQLAQALADLTAKARAGTLPTENLTGGTFTLNNYGVFGVDGSTPIINHPEAAILGVGRIVDKPWVVDGQLAVRKVTQLSFSFDHRVCDGGAAGGFLRYVADCVENPAVLLAHV